MLRCGKDGLKGTFAIEGVGKRYSAALVKIVWLDGQSHVYTLSAAHPSVQLFGSADDRRGLAEIFQTYTVLGVQHILSVSTTCCSWSVCCSWLVFASD